MVLAKRLCWTGYLAYHMRGQARYPFKPLAAIKRDQARRVRKMVAYAYRQVPYYRETMDRLGLRPSDFGSAEDLGKLPILERRELQRDPENFVSKAHPVERCLLVRSGGSTGEPKTVYRDLPSLLQTRAHDERMRPVIAKTMGRTVGYRKTDIGSPASSFSKGRQFCRARSLSPRRVSVQHQDLSLLDSPEENVHLLNQFKPDVLQTYGSYLELLFPYLYATGEPFHRPKVVIYTSDDLSGSVRRLIEEEFKIPVFSSYQATEASRIGFECEGHLGLHLNIDLYPVRIVDPEGRTLSVGESGDVIISNLVNRATVLLNYRLGDIAALLPDRCSCGRSLPLLSFPQGRIDNWIELASGQLFHTQAVRTIFSHDEADIWQYQVVQHTSKHLSVSVVAAETCDRQQTRERIAAECARKFGEGVTVDISFVDSIERTAGGKLCPVLSLHGRSP
jgi:phenylacetate-CoA ligase